VKVSALLLVAALSTVAAPDPVDDFLRLEMARQQIPGLTLAVVRDGEVVRTGAYGKADLELDVPASVEQVFEIGSVTKQFTAVLALMLAEEGKLSLDDPLAKYIDGAPEHWRPITLCHLLSHTSGLKEYVVLPGFRLHEEFEMDRLLEAVRPLPLDFAPGETHAYSNTGFALMRLVLEKASGKAYADLLRQRILEPVGMERTRLLNPYEIVPNRAHGYLKHGGELIRPQRSVLAALSDGALISTVGDLAKYDRALHGGRLLKPASYRSLHDPIRLNSGRTRSYGLGTFLSRPGLPAFAGHHGSSPGYSAGYGHFPTARLSVIVLGNVYSFNGQALVTQIAELLEPSLRPASSPSRPDPDPRRTERLREHLSALAENRPAAEFLEPEFLAPLQTDRARMGPGPHALFRSLESLEYVGERKEGADTVVEYRLEAGGRRLLGVFVLSPGGKIADLWLRADRR
jgi:D-alanyl-D-alanine carboxypeptidase